MENERGCEFLFSLLGADFGERAQYNGWGIGDIHVFVIINKCNIETVHPMPLMKSFHHILITHCRLAGYYEGQSPYDLTSPCYYKCLT